VRSLLWKAKAGGQQYISTLVVEGSTAAAQHSVDVPRIGLQPQKSSQPASCQAADGNVASAVQRFMSSVCSGLQQRHLSHTKCLVASLPAPTGVPTPVLAPLTARLCCWSAATATTPTAPTSRRQLLQLPAHATWPVGLQSVTTPASKLTNAQRATVDMFAANVRQGMGRLGLSAAESVIPGVFWCLCMSSHVFCCWGL
jgi:hypothetical protein